MRLVLSAAVIVTTASVGTAFVPASTVWGISGHLSQAVSAPALSSTIEDTDTSESTSVVSTTPAHVNGAEQKQSNQSNSPTSLPLTGAEIKARLESQLEKLRQKDATSRKLNKEDLQIVYEDNDIIVVNKPTGVLSVADHHDEFPSLASAVFAAVKCDLPQPDHMVVHRLGMDTSGLMVLAKTMPAVCGLNAMLRSRKMERTYEALVCGHVAQNEGFIDVPLMRDYEFPPFMRVSTETHQQFLADLDDAAAVGKKILEQPKDSLTKYQVVAREEMAGQPVTRVLLTSISGRTHQLNVHLAALGHPIVGDTVYGWNGTAAANGGLSEAEQNSLFASSTSRASVEVQQALAKAAPSSCVHAKSLKFRHPVSKQEISLTVDAPF